MKFTAIIYVEFVCVYHHAWNVNSRNLIRNHSPSIYSDSNYCTFALLSMHTLIIREITPCHSHNDWNWIYGYLHRVFSTIHLVHLANLHMYMYIVGNSFTESVSCQQLASSPGPLAFLFCGKHWECLNMKLVYSLATHYSCYLSHHKL